MDAGEARRHSAGPAASDARLKKARCRRPDTAAPPPVTGLSLASSPDGSTVSISWPNYNQWSVRDVAAYRIYRSAAPFTGIDGLTPAAVVSGENFSRAFSGLTPWADSFWAVVAVDGQGNANPAVTYQAVYVLSPQSISREVTLFNGHEPLPPKMPEIISREVSVVIASPTVPDPVTGIATTFQPSTSIHQYSAVDIDWTGYNEAAQRDIKRYRIYRGDAYFDNVTGMEPAAFSADGTQKHTLPVPGGEQIYFIAVVAEDMAGQFNPVVYAESVKASPSALGEVSNVLATAEPSSITWTWDLGGVGTDLQNFVREFRVYLDGARDPVVLDRLARSWTALSLDFGHSYSVRITTVDVLGHESAGVTVVTGTPEIPPGSAEVA